MVSVHKVQRGLQYQAGSGTVLPPCEILVREFHLAVTVKPCSLCSFSFIHDNDNESEREREREAGSHFTSQIYFNQIDLIFVATVSTLVAEKAFTK